MKNPINLDTLMIADEAKQHQLNDQDVINATIGSIYDESHQFHAFDTVLKSIQTLSHKYPYTKPEGLLHVGDLWWNHLSKGKLTLPKKHMMTLGGTGALYLLFRSFFTDRDVIINAVPTWNNNYQMLEHQGIAYDTFYMFDHNQQYDFTTLKTTIDQALKEKDKIGILINDPSHNPSGYTMDEKSWITLLELINGYQQKDRIFLINDMAYVDYADRDFDFYDLLNRYLHHTTMFMSFSGSKAFSLYGARVGMLVSVSRNQDLLEKIFNQCTYIARSTYSLPSSFGFQVIEDIFQNKYQDYIDELQSTKALLKNRSQALMDVLNDKGIQYLPYHHGFFVTVKTNHPLAVFQHLKELGIYTIPVEFGIRFAVSSLTKKDIDQLKVHLNKTMFE